MSTFDARDLSLSIDKVKLKSLYKVQLHRILFDLLFDWAIIITVAFISELYFNPLLYVVAVIVIGARMHALGVVMHDVAHHRFLKNTKLGDLLINLFVCWPMFFSVSYYRHNHLLHHQHLNTSEDPDWVAKIGRAEFSSPQTKKQFLSRVSLYFAFQGLKDLVRLLIRMKKSSPVKKQWGPVVFVVLLFILLSLFGYWKIYLLYWVVPYLTTLMMFKYIRSFAEHCGDLEYEHLLNSTRTVNATFLEKFFIAPHNVHYHIEHHLYPGVPYYNLPKLKRMLTGDVTYKANAHYSNGYFSGLLKEL